MSDNRFRAHLSRGTEALSSGVDRTRPECLPSQALRPDSEHVRELLEELDDVIFAAIRGNFEALEKARVLWPQVLANIGWELTEESREQYLRYAIEVTKRHETNGMRSPERSLHALEIISLLTKS